MSGAPLGKKNKLHRAVRLHDRSLEEQLRELDLTAPPGPVVFDGKLLPPSSDRMAWVRRRQEIVTRLRRREAKRMADPGPDPSGNYSPSPYAARDHVVEVAPKELKASADSINFPKRITTQRMIDRYKAQGLLTARQWRAADRLWRIWRQTGRDPNMIANYSPDQVRGSGDPDGKMVGRGDAVADMDFCRVLTGVLGFSLLVHVVIWDRPASEWTAIKRTSARYKKAFGMDMLQQNLDILARHFRY